MWQLIQRMWWLSINEKLQVLNKNITSINNNITSSNNNITSINNNITSSNNNHSRINFILQELEKIRKQKVSTTTKLWINWFIIFFLFSGYIIVCNIFTGSTLNYWQCRRFGDTVKGQCHENFVIFSFHELKPSGPLIYRLKWFCWKICFHEDIYKISGSAQC